MLGMGLLIGLGCLLVAAVEPDGPKPVEYITIGVLLGTMFGQATLASAWTALGPLPLVWRLPLSIAWLAGLLVAFAMNLAFHNGPGPADIIIVIGGCLVGQWFLAQLPLWGLAGLFGARVRQVRGGSSGAATENQFGIRQLMIITATVAVVLGFGRAVVLAIAPTFDGRVGGEATIFVFLAAAGILMTLPLIVAALLPRLALPASLVVLVLIGLGTAWELPLMRAFQTATGPDTWHFVWINGVQAAWVLAVAGVVRLGGYRLMAISRPGADSLAK
jgi:hypothetical protein